MNEVKEILKKRQNTNICQMVLSGSRPTEKLSYCEQNDTCTVDLSTCSSTKMLIQC